MLGWILFGAFFALLIVNVPVAVALAASSAVALWVSGTLSSVSQLVDIMYASISKFTLLAIPFFILAGVIMDYAGISKRLIDFADVFVGHIKGGIVLVTVIAAIFFAAISGSGPATVAALGSILIPALVKNGYSKPTAAALLSSSGAMGIVIPPSIAFIVYAAVAGDQAPVSIGRLFIAGIVPGLLMGISFVLATFMASRWNKDKDPMEYAAVRVPYRQRASFLDIIRAFFRAFWGLLIPVIILGGIYSGVFTATESAIVAVFYALFVGFFIYRELKVKDLVKILVDSAQQTAVVMLIVSAASVFAYIITKQHIATSISEFLLTISDNQVIILLLINIILLIAGAFMDAVSAFYIFVPILMPIVLHYGIDPVVFGVIMTVNLAIGLYTPPVGANLYVASGMSNTSLVDISKGAVPYIIAGIIVLMIITYFPIFSTWLPDLLGVQ